MEEEALKVYTILAAEYTIIKSDEEMTETKYLNIKAKPIL